MSDGEGVSAGDTSSASAEPVAEIVPLETVLEIKTAPHNEPEAATADVQPHIPRGVGTPTHVGILLEGARGN